VEYVVDRVETVATVWLGLTAGCGRCHDHKYDPISQKEFYSLYAYFNNVAEAGGVDRRNSTAAPVLGLPTAEQQAQIDVRTKEIGRLEGQLKALEARLRADEGDWERGLKTDRMTANLVAVLRTPPGQRTAGQAKALLDHHVAVSPERQAAQRRLEQARKSLD